MANLSNINNKFLFTDGDFLKIGNLAPINNISGTESGISITNSNVASITLDNTAASGKKYVMYSDDGGKLNFYDADASSGRLVIDSSGNSTFVGNVGIGAAASDGNLHVRKTGINTGITNVLMNANFADGSNGTGLSIGYRTDETTAVLAARTATGNIAFYSYDGGWSESMRITNTGNVGIGATTVTQKGFWFDTTNNYLSINKWSSTATPAAMLHLFGGDNDIDVPAIIIEGRDNPGDTRLKIAVKDPQVRFLLDEGSDAVNGYGLMTFETTAQPNAAASERGGFDFDLPGGTAMTIINTGHVGIGTASPTATLDVHAPSTTAPSLTMGAAAGQIFKNEDSELAFGLMNASPYNVWMQSRFNGDVARPFLINPLGGNVGIGTTSPDSKLDVKGASATPADGNQTLSITNSTGGTQLNLGTAENAYGWIEAREGATLRNLLLNPNGGNVGIGTTSPDAKLHIYGSSSLSEMYLGEDAAADKAGILKYTQGDGSGTGVITLSHWGNNSLTEGLAVKYGGNVGIGTTSPSAPLTVHGQQKWYTTNGDGNELRGFFNPGGSGDPAELSLYQANASTVGVELRATGNSYFNGGNVGIGITPSNGYKLDVFDATEALFRIRTSNATGNGGVYVGNGDRNWATLVRHSQGEAFEIRDETANVTRMSILSTGEVVIGDSSATTISTDPIHSLGDVNRDGVTSSLYARLVMQERSGNWISFVDATPTHYGTISKSGSGVNYGSNSDYRLKENILDLTNSINKVKLLSPKTFNFIDRADTTVTGFLAHEVQEIVSEAVTGEKDGTITTGNVINNSDGTVLEQNVIEPETLETGTSFTAIKTEPEYQQLDQAKLVPILIGALKELIAKVEKLEKK